jgi:hypothetical protein
VERYPKIGQLDDEVQARLVESVLRERGIPHALRSYHDSVLDGLFQHAKGWGHVEAPEAYRAEVEEILREVRGTPPA